MPAPSKVNFPGQKQRIRMRGTKQASKDVKQRLKKNLAELRESPESLLPVYNGPKIIKWGRKSPVYSTLEEINKITGDKLTIPQKKLKLKLQVLDQVEKKINGIVFWFICIIVFVNGIH